MDRDKLLEILEGSGENPVSGEQLSRRLGVTRAAVWKQVRALRSLGYRITGSTRSGYRFQGAPDLLYPREIRKSLKAKVLGRELLHFRRVGSTNQVVLDLGRRGYPEGTVVVAEEQTAGRGRWQRNWFSPPETGIWLSLLLRPALTPLQLPQVTLVVGASCARAVRAEVGVPAGIKWPNDLVWEGRKLGGILVEMEAAAEQVHYLVVGIGINVNQSPSDFPPELKDTAISLRMITGRPVERVPLVRRLLEVLEEDYLRFCREGFAPLREAWLRYQVTLGHRVQARLGERELTGVAEELDPDGNLLLRLPGGDRQRLNAGEIAFCH